MRLSLKVINLGVEKFLKLGLQCTSQQLMIAIKLILALMDLSTRGLIKEKTIQFMSVWFEGGLMMSGSKLNFPGS